jgi:hypothetical protein
MMTIVNNNVLVHLENAKMVDFKVPIIKVMDVLINSI